MNGCDGGTAYIISHLNVGGAQIAAVEKARDIGGVVITGHSINSRFENERNIIRIEQLSRSAVCLLNPKLYYKILTVLKKYNIRKIIVTGVVGGGVAIVLKWLTSSLEINYRCGGVLKNNKSKLIDLLLWSYESLVIRSSKLVCVTCEQQKRLVLYRYNIATSKKVFVDPSLSICFSVWSEDVPSKVDSVPDKLGADGFPLQLVSCFSMIKSKGCVEIILVGKMLLKEKIEFRWVVIGGGSLYNDFREQILVSGLSNHVFAIGELSLVDLELSKHDVFVHLSTYYEGFPQVIAQALNKNLPVLCFDAGGVSDRIISGLNGYIFSPSDLGGLVDVIKYLYFHPKYLEWLSNKCSLTIPKLPDCRIFNDKDNAALIE